MLTTYAPSRTLTSLTEARIGLRVWCSDYRHPGRGVGVVIGRKKKGVLIAVKFKDVPFRVMRVVAVWSLAIRETLDEFDKVE